MKKEDLDRVTKVIDLWIDIGAASHDEAVNRVRVGDAGVLDTRVEEYPNGRIVSRSLDNRIGAFVAAEAMRRLATQRPKHAAVFSVASTREEIAWTGSGARTSAVGIEPDVAVVVDVTHATDYPGADKKRPQPLHAQSKRDGGARGPRSRRRSPRRVCPPPRTGDGLYSQIAVKKAGPRRTARGPELVRSYDTLLQIHPE